MKLLGNYNVFMAVLSNIHVLGTIYNFDEHKDLASNLLYN